jgi:Gamma-glutamyltransferase
MARYGTMGGEGQPQTQAAIVTRMVDFGLSPHDAVAAPRWLYGRSWGLPVNNLRLEGRFSPQLAEALTKQGHSVERIADFSDLMGHAGAILCDQDTGVLFGATDPRSDGLAAGY